MLKLDNDMLFIFSIIFIMASFTLLIGLGCAELEVENDDVEV